MPLTWIWAIGVGFPGVIKLRREEARLHDHAAHASQPRFLIDGFTVASGRSVTALGRLCSARTAPDRVSINRAMSYHTVSLCIVLSSSFRRYASCGDRLGSVCVLDTAHTSSTASRWRGLKPRCMV